MNHKIDFKKILKKKQFFPLIGVYDVFSALIASRYFEGVFVSGYSFSASSYGLPDVGFVNWRDIVDISNRIRNVLPETPMLVDIDDGFGDETVAVNTIKLLENNSCSAVMLEDQKRPRRCGHFDGKLILPIDEYLVKLNAVLDIRTNIFVLARTDAPDPEEGIERAIAFSEAGADAVMVEAVNSLEYIQRLVDRVNCPVVVNQLHGGKSPDWSFQELTDAGVSIGIYSTPCLYAAQFGIESYLKDMLESSGLPAKGTVNMEECNRVLLES
ncbi:MAG: carboxyvinyl-carboxyphosphonate phosphorylmutase [Legionellales bacterium]|nr:carboxyvinyl-carboxyphosphonate phosphorylmutase [Legionellales bacterium]